jgi:ABC-type phosphate transport system substrate-binding protein
MRLWIRKTTNILNLPATGAIVQAVGQTKGAIGYIGLAYETKEAKQSWLSTKENQEPLKR